MALRLDGHDDEWTSVEPIALQHDIEDGLEPPQEAAPRIRMGWTTDGIAVHACYRASRDSAANESPVLSLMMGATEPREPALRSGDRNFEISWTAGEFSTAVLPADA